MKEQGQPLLQTAKNLERDIHTVQTQLKELEENLQINQKNFLKFLDCWPFDSTQAARQLEKLLQQREIASCINLVQSLSYEQLFATLQHFKADSLELLPRIFWFHSPYLDPQTEELAQALTISPENLSSLTAMLYITCCYTAGPKAFELLELEKLMPLSESENAKIEDLIDLCDKHQIEINQKIPNFAVTVKGGLQKIINFARGQAEWHGIVKESAMAMREEFCRQVAVYIKLIKAWTPTEIAETLIQLSAIQVDCGTGVVSLLIQKLNEGWRAQKGLQPNSWIEAGQHILEPVRYQLFQELIVQLANSQGEINTHTVSRFYSMAQKLNLGIRGASIADFKDEYDKRLNNFTPVRLAQFKRSFDLKYLPVLIYLKFEDFLEDKVFGLRQTKPDPTYQFYAKEIKTMWEKKYGPYERWHENGPYQLDDCSFPEGLKPEAKIDLLVNFKFFTRRPFQNKLKLEPSNQLSVGFSCFNIRMIKDALIALPTLLNWKNPASGDTLLHWIAKQHPDVMDQLLPLLDCPEERRRCNNRNGHNPMHMAARYASLEGLKRFLKYYENELKQQNNLDLNPVIERKDSERLACFQLMVDTIYAIDPQRINRGVNGEGPPLVVLARDNRLDCLDYLITKFGNSLNLNVTRERKETALYVASIKGYTQFAKRLIELGCKVDEPDYQNNTPLLTAAYHGHHDLVLLLIEQGKADLHKKNSQGKTAIFYAAQAGHTQVLVALYEKGALLTDQNQRGQDLLAAASANGRVKTVEKLLDLGVSINSFTHNQETPLFLASSKGHHEIVHLLLKKGADALLTDRHGLTPLAVAAKEGHLKCIRELIPYTPIQKEEELGDCGGAALDVAAKRGHEECYQELKRFGYQHSFHYTSTPDQEGLI